MTPYWIVIAWVTMDGLEPTGRDVRFDRYNTRPEFVAAPLAKACTWTCGSEDPDDLRAAHLHAKRYGYSVMTFPESEGDPLGRARSAALAMFHREEIGVAS